MSWYQAPAVEQHDEANVAIFRLTGDWTRDLPLDVRRAAVEALAAKFANHLVLDLADARFIDSWGEETICDALGRAAEQGKRGALLIDKARYAEYEGVKHALERRKLDVASFDDRATAIAAVQRAP